MRQRTPEEEVRAAQEIFGLLVCLRRTHLGLAQAQLSARMIQEQWSVVRIEQGKDVVSLETLLQFAEVLSCPVDSLLPWLPGTRRLRPKRELLMAIDEEVRKAKADKSGNGKEEYDEY